MSSHSTRQEALSLSDDILRWPPLLAGGDIDVLIQDLMKDHNRPLSRHEVEAALQVLSRRELIEWNSLCVRASEPDRPETEIYQPLEGQLLSTKVLADIGINSDEYVFQKTATGGNLGDGRLSRPDFTLAAIRSWRFDPQRTLEVYSFEVKNRAGASVSAVYEAVAHGRFAHHPYLVCPRSRFREDEAIKEACGREGVGLILFNIVAPGDGTFCVEALEVVSVAERRAADPQLVERHLKNRLRAENQKQLVAYAKGVQP